MNETAPSFYVTMELLLHVGMANRAMEAVQNILTLLDCRDGILKLKGLNVAIRTIGSTKPSEMPLDLAKFQWSSTAETVSSGS